MIGPVNALRLWTPPANGGIVPPWLREVDPGDVPVVPLPGPIIPPSGGDSYGED